MTEQVIITQALKSCAHCGEQPKWRGTRSDYARGIFRLQCLGETHLVQSYGATEEAAIAAWNARIESSPTDGQEGSGACPTGTAALVQAPSPSVSALTGFDPLAGLTEAQQTCGDVIDRLPCLRCGATSLKDCTLPIAGRAAAVTIINNTPGLDAQLLAKREAMAKSERPS